MCGGSDVGGCVYGGDMDGGSAGRRSAGRESSIMGTDGGSALTRTQVLAAAERALGFACLLDCSPAPYGLSLANRLRLGSLMCWAVSPLSTFPWRRFFPWFPPICAAISGQVC